MKTIYVTVRIDDKDEQGELTYSSIETDEFHLPSDDIGSWNTAIIVGDFVQTKLIERLNLTENV